MANHAAFMEKIQLIADKNERMRQMKEYWQGFPADEYINFLQNNMKEIGEGLEEIIAKNALSKESAKLIKKNLAKGMAEINAMKSKLIAPQVS